MFRRRLKQFRALRLKKKLGNEGGVSFTPVGPGSMTPKRATNFILQSLQKGSSANGLLYLNEGTFSGGQFALFQFKPVWGPWLETLKKAQQPTGFQNMMPHSKIVSTVKHPVGNLNRVIANPQKKMLLMCAVMLAKKKEEAGEA
mmetsp:Transcript_6105/g.7484  ORF Transcript_6105/g.7484 Transcript_6105/m.7484 type:complete len:144 (+) Transcript_6105:44-475(+)